MIPSSALRIAAQTASLLVITDPPFSLMGTIFLVIGIVIVLVILGLVIKARAKRALILVMGIALSAPFILVGAFFCTAQNQMVFSRPSNRITVVNQYFAGMISSRQVIPLDSIQSAEIETARAGTRRLVLVNHSGKSIPLTQFTGQHGYHQAADAINHFLGAALLPGQPGPQGPSQ